MKTISLKFLMIYITMALTTCNSNEDLTLNDADYIIFGHYYGHCVGEECVETFKLTKYKLYEDTIDSYAGNGEFDFVELSEDKFQKVRTILENFPKNLLKEKPTTFGCPDCADQGGILIIYSKNGVEKRWRLDHSKNDVPSYLHPFIDEVNNSISIINN